MFFHDSLERGGRGKQWFSPSCGGTKRQWEVGTYLFGKHSKLIVQPEKKARNPNPQEVHLFFNRGRKFAELI